MSTASSPILVTGVAGFIGFHVTKRLLERGDTDAYRINAERGTITYRTRVAGVLLKRAATIAADRARGA